MESEADSDFSYYSDSSSSSDTETDSEDEGGGGRGGHGGRQKAAIAAAAKRQKKKHKTPPAAPQALPKQKEEEEEQQQQQHEHDGVKCSLCQDLCATVVMRPCGHRMSCVACWKPSLERLVAIGALSCSICREKVEGTLEIPGAKFTALAAQLKVCCREGCTTELNKRRYFPCHQFGPFCVDCISCCLRQDELRGRLCLRAGHG